METLNKILKIGIGKIAQPSLVVGKHEIPVFMFHQVLDDETYSQKLDRSICLNKNKFEDVLLVIKNNFDVICLKKLIEQGPLQKHKRNCIITFDDGWLDSYQVAFPILKKYSLPATMFISTGLVGTMKKIWFERLSDIINLNYLFDDDLIKKMNYLLVEKNKTIKFDIKKEKVYFQACSILKNMAQKKIDLYLENLESIVKMKDNLRIRTIMNWAEVQKLSDNNISFGSHGVTHSILTKLNSNEKYFEICKSREDLLTKNINYVDCLSFPNGNYDQEILDIAAHAGYSLFFTASIKKCGEGESPFLVKRINVSEKNIQKNQLFYSILKAKIKKGLFKPESAACWH